MDLEIQRVARELYKAFSGLNEEFERPQDQVGPIQLLEYQILWDGMGGTPFFFFEAENITPILLSVQTNRASLYFLQTSFRPNA